MHSGRRLRAACLVALLTVGTCSSIHPTPAIGNEDMRDAELLGRWARESMAEGTLESRRRALRYLDDAIELDPDNSNLWTLLGQAKLVSGFDHESRSAFRQAIQLDSGNKAAWFELGMFYKREWIRDQGYISLRHAIGAFDTATTLRPGASDAWLQLVPLYYAQENFAAAEHAARRSLAGRPRRLESRLAFAHARYRRGAFEQADSVYRSTLPLLEGELRELYEDPSKMIGGVPHAISWDGLDPDPTTPENEIQLEFWSRVSQAVLLFHDPVRPGLDSRAETYIRYGPPARIEKNPFGVPLFFRSSGVGGDAPVVDFAAHVVAWHYPELGMRIVLQDRSLQGRFTREARRDFDPLSVPNPAVLARRGDLLALGDGLAVFPRLPPPDLRLDMQSFFARFEGEDGPRLFAQVEAAGDPSDALEARWVVRDSALAVLDSAVVRLGLSACDPGGKRQAQFWAELPSGAYDVAISVRDASNRRGLHEERIVLAEQLVGMSLSDLVLVCGDPRISGVGGSARFDANVEARVSGGQPLAAYMEFYDLATGEDGSSHFEYEIQVQKAVLNEERWEWGATVIESSRREEHTGTLRRQFLSVPTQSLPAGRYRVRVNVRDLLSGAEAMREAGFVRQ